MAVIIPSSPPGRDASPGERRLYRILSRASGTEDWIVLHSYDLPRHRTQVQGEIDFIVLIPGKGILCLEVKAHRQVVVQSDGLWRLGADPPTRRSPFKQVRDNMHSLIDALRLQRTDLTDVPVWSAVVFTDTGFSARSPEWHPWEVVDATRLLEPIDIVLTSILQEAAAYLPTKQSSAFSVDRCRQVARTLRPTVEVLQSPRARRATADAELQAFTEEQYAALDLIDSDWNPRVVFTGPAGTGKTVLALETARRLAARGKKTLLLCFNAQLGRALAEAMQALAPEVEVRTLHGLMTHIVGEGGAPSRSPEYFTCILPQKAAEELLGAERAPNFDAIVIDEAQDILRQAYLDVVDLLLAGGFRDGSWTLFGDFERQALYDSADMGLDHFVKTQGSPPVVSLRVNCRNTPAIVEYATLWSGLNPGYSAVRRPDDGVLPRTIYFTSREDQARKLEGVLEELYEDGYAGEDVVVLSPLRAHCAAGGISRQPWGDRLKPYETAQSRGYVRWTTVHAFKGLEAPVVILTDIDDVVGPRAEALFYTGVTRATDRLIVLANEDVAAAFMALIGGGGNR